MTVLRKLWWGGYPLPVTFWLFYCVGSVALALLCGAIIFLSRTINARPAAFIVGFAVSWGYWLVASMGVWQSATPYWTSPIWMQRIWAAAARVVVAIGIGRFVLGLINGGAAALIERIMSGATDF